MSIWLKILEVQKAAKTIAKNGKNDAQNYNYAREQDVLTGIKNLMNEHGLIAIPTLEGYETLQVPNRNGGMSVQVLQRINYRVVDTETGEMVESVVLGQGVDNGDKAAYKAATGASKYFHLKFFGVATGEDEPEAGYVAPPQAKQTPQRAQAPGPVNDIEKQRAQGVANKIITFQRANGLSDDQIKAITGLKSIRGLVNVGGVKTLEKALEALQRAQRQAAI